MHKALHKGNWKASIAAVTPGFGFGWSAGAMIAWRSSMKGEALHLGTLPEQQGRAAYAKIFLKGDIQVIAVSIYLWVGVGASGPHLGLMGDISKTLLGLCKPFVIFGDWNMEIDELKETGWLEHIGGGPGGSADPICHLLGRQGRQAHRLFRGGQLAAAKHLWHRSSTGEPIWHA